MTHWIPALQERVGESLCVYRRVHHPPANYTFRLNLHLYASHLHTEPDDVTHFTASSAQQTKNTREVVGVSVVFFYQAGRTMSTLYVSLFNIVVVFINCKIDDILLSYTALFLLIHVFTVVGVWTLHYELIFVCFALLFRASDLQAQIQPVLVEGARICSNFFSVKEVFLGVFPVDVVMKPSEALRDYLLGCTNKTVLSSLKMC